MEVPKGLISPFFVIIYVKINKFLATREENLRFRYGIGVEDYEEMYKNQKGKCAICKKKEKKNLDVDHCHATGKIRGLLCRNCNTALGKVYDDPKILAKMFMYLYERREPKEKRTFSEAFSMLDIMHDVHGARELWLSNNSPFPDCFPSVSGCTNSVRNDNESIKEDVTDTGIFFISCSDVPE